MLDMLRKATADGDVDVDVLRERPSMLSEHGLHVPQPVRLVPHQFVAAVEVVEDQGDLVVRVTAEQSRHPGFEAFIQRGDLVVGTVAIDLHLHLAAVVKVAHPASESTCLETVDERRDRRSPEAGLFCDLPRGQRAAPVQEVEGLEVGWVDSDTVRDGLA